MIPHRTAVSADLLSWHQAACACRTRRELSRGTRASRGGVVAPLAPASRTAKTETAARGRSWEGGGSRLSWASRRRELCSAERTEALSSCLRYLRYRRESCERRPVMLLLIRCRALCEGECPFEASSPVCAVMRACGDVRRPKKSGRLTQECASLSTSFRSSGPASTNVSTTTSRELTGMNECERMLEWSG